MKKRFLKGFTVGVMTVSLLATELFSGGILQRPSAIYAAYTDENGFTISNDVIYQYDGPGGDIVIPQGILGIADGVFMNNDTITSVTFPDSVEYIEADAFAGCKKLTTLYFAEGLREIYAGAFCECKALKKVVLPDTVTSIGIGAFEDCTSLTSVTFSKNLTGIANAAFSGCKSLKEVILPEKISYIGPVAFAGCTALSKLYLPAGLTEIEMGAFEGCTSLVNVAIPLKTQIIREGAFADCTNLKTLTLPVSVTELSDNAFLNCKNLTLYCPYVAYGAPDNYWVAYAKKNKIPYKETTWILPYVDVIPGTWQYTVAQFMYGCGYITGTTATTFSPNSPMTRAQFMVILWRMCGSTEMEVTKKPYTDVSVTSFGAEAITWAKTVGIASGYTDGSFKPGANMTREQFVAFLYRFASKYWGADVSIHGKSYLECSDAKDVNKTFETQIEWAYENGFIGASGQLMPKKAITRMEAATILYRFLVANSVG